MKTSLNTLSTTVHCVNEEVAKNALRSIAEDLTNSIILSNSSDEKYKISSTMDEKSQQIPTLLLMKLIIPSFQFPVVTQTLS